MVRVARNGVEVYYTTGGKPDGTPLILVHGAGSNHTTWIKTIEGLNGVRWAAIDTRGHGRTGGNADLHETVQDVLAVADAEGMRKFSIAGICVGGTIATEVARRAPKRVTGVVIISPFDTFLIKGASALWYFCRALLRLFSLFRPRRKLRYVDFRKTPNVPWWLTPVKDLPGVHARQYARSTLGGLKTKLRLERIKAPVIIITGKDDRTLRTKVLDQRVRAHPKARWFVLNSNHHVLTWKPDKVSELINKFVEGSLWRA